MQWTGLLVAAAAVAAAAVAAVPAENGVHAPQGWPAGTPCGPPGVCSCVGASVLCECHQGMENLVVSAGQIPPRMSALEVKECKSVTLQERALTHNILEIVKVVGVQEFIIERRVFNVLQSLLVEDIPKLIFQKGAFEGVTGLTKIVIKSCDIPLIPEYSLYNITNVKEFIVSDVKIKKIDKNAILIDMNTDGSRNEIRKTTIEHIEERGLQIGNTTDVVIVDNEIVAAVPNSIRISSRNEITIEGNKFHTGVDVHAIRIQYNNTIRFTNNTMLNVDIQNAISLEKMKEGDTVFTVERLLTSYGGNNVQCKCINPALNVTEQLKQNFCFRVNCTGVTVAAFLQSCQKNNKETPEDIFRALCKTESNPIPSHDEHTATTHKPRTTSGGRTSIFTNSSIFFLSLLYIYFI